MAAQSKAQLLTDVHTLLKRRYKPGPRPDRLSVFEAVVYGICHENTTREQANQALARFKDHFFDWNEVRVSTVGEIETVLAGLPAPDVRAQRIRRFLRQLFSSTYGFTLETLLKKPLKDAIKSLREFEALQSDFVLATVIQQSLGGHAIPVDVPIRRGLERLGVADPEVDLETLRSTLERAVPKNRGVEFDDLIEDLTHDTCVEGEPDCPRCELKKICPTGQAKLAADRAGAKPSKAAKPAPAAAPEPDGKPKAGAAKPKLPAPKAKSEPAPTPKAKPDKAKPAKAEAAKPDKRKERPK